MVEEQVKTLERALKRIFALKMTRSSYREVQNILVMLSNGTVPQAQAIMESFITGHPSSKLGFSPDETFKRLMKEYGELIAISKEVHDKGDCLAIITSEALRQDNQFAFLHRVKKIDGEESHFVTEVDATLHLAGHFLQRLLEVKKTPEGQVTLSHHKQGFEALSHLLEQLKK